MTDIEYLRKYLPEDKLEEGIQKLEKGIPVQYIVGNVDFYGNIFEVNENVLIPRFETEELVDKTINYINEYFDKKVKIVDIGTGSGCIAITLQKVLDAEVDAVDISSEALEVAKRNNLNNKTRVNFIKGNLLDNLKDKYDVLISNPPYIEYDDPEVMDIVKNNEPHLALYADNKGLACYEEILKNANKYLNKKSLIAFEIGYKQASSIKEIISKYFKDSIVKVEKDLQNRDRFIFIFNK